MIIFFFIEVVFCFLVNASEVLFRDNAHCDLQQQYEFLLRNNIPVLFRELQLKELTVKILSTMEPYFLLVNCARISKQWHQYRHNEEVEKVVDDIIAFNRELGTLFTGECIPKPVIMFKDQRFCSEFFPLRAKRDWYAHCLYGHCYIEDGCLHFMNRVIPYVDRIKLIKSLFGDNLLMKRKILMHKVRLLEYKKLQRTRQDCLYRLMHKTESKFAESEAKETQKDECITSHANPNDEPVAQQIYKHKQDDPQITFVFSLMWQILAFMRDVFNLLANSVPQLEYDSSFLREFNIAPMQYSATFIETVF
jgi:hypothetical protein